MMYYTDPRYKLKWLSKTFLDYAFVTTCTQLLCSPLINGFVYAEYSRDAIGLTVTWKTRHFTSEKIN